MPLISVIIPIYKGEKYILQALESVKRQTYPEWEIVVVEDGYRDRAEEIVGEFAQTVPLGRVKFIHLDKNKGPSVARNIAIRHALGEYLAFLDCDDIWNEKHLQETVKIVEEQNADLVYSPLILFDEERKASGTHRPQPEELKDFPGSLFYR